MPLIIIERKFETNAYSNKSCELIKNNDDIRNLAPPRKIRNLSPSLDSYLKNDQS